MRVRTSRRRGPSLAVPGPVLAEALRRPDGDPLRQRVLAGLDDRALDDLWHATDRALARSGSAGTVGSLIRVADLRATLLDELERRRPDRFQRLLARLGA